MSKKAKTTSSTSPAPIAYHEPKVMAEIGCNHMGDLEIAKELLTLAKQCGCEYGKFQKRCPKELLTKAQYEAPHPNPRNSYGDTYGAHREFLELTIEQHAELKEHCDKIGLGYSCSVWDLTSAKELVSINPDLIKVGSPSNQHWDMQKVLRDNYTGDVHISTGMTTKVHLPQSRRHPHPRVTAHRRLPPSLPLSLSPSLLLSLPPSLSLSLSLSLARSLLACRVSPSRSTRFLNGAPARHAPARHARGLMHTTQPSAPSHTPHPPPVAPVPHRRRLRRLSNSGRRARATPRTDSSSTTARLATRCPSR